MQLWSPRSRPHLRHVPRSLAVPVLRVAGGQDGATQGAAGGSRWRAHGCGHGSIRSPIYIPFRSDTAQRAARPSPGGTGTGSCCLLCPEPLLMCPVCLSVRLSQHLSLWEECLPEAASALFMHPPPSSSSYAWLCRCSGGILRKSKMFPKCFLFLNNSGDRGLPSSPMSLSV